jgi:hypothetical protein
MAKITNAKESINYSNAWNLKSKMKSTMVKWWILSKTATILDINVINAVIWYFAKNAAKLG